MNIYITFCDAMLFRKCMPFDAGIHRRATSFFPPTPSTIQGAIRSLILSHNNINYTEWMSFLKREKDNDILKNIKEKIGDNINLGKLVLKGPYIAEKINDKFELYFNAPLDLVSERKKQIKDIIYLKPTNFKLLANKYNFYYDLFEIISYLPWNKRIERLENLNNYFINTNGLKKYLLNKNLDRSDFILSYEIYKIERRPGIWRENKLAKEGMLYFADYIRINNNFGLIEEINYIDKNDVELNECDVFPFGGQTKIAKYEKINLDPFEDINKLKKEIFNYINDNKKLKLIFLTPSYFKDYKYLDNSEILTKFELITLCIGKPIIIGGWDLAYNKPKDAMRYIPAGSVYFFKLKDGENLSIDEFNKLWLNSILNDYLSQYGYGITICGIW